MSIRKTFTGRHLARAATAAAALTLATAGTAAATPSAKPMRTGSDLGASSVSASVANNTLTILGTDGPDQITVGLASGDPNSLIVDTGNGDTQTFDRLTFTAISVFLGDGNDTFTETRGFADDALVVDGGNGDDTIVTGDGNDVIFGGAGNDTIHSGSGDDVIFGGSGDDFVDGDAGHDSAFLDSGRDAFNWDPGDGSDFIEGGTGRDTLLFNGSNAAENMSLSADGHSAVFLRDVGGIRMDMNDVEQVDVHALGGADHVTVNDVSGTDIGSVNVDLASATGTGDGSTDIVSVNGTESVDH